MLSSLRAMMPKMAANMDGTQPFERGYFDAFAAKEGFADNAAQQAELYANAQPFPHIVMQDMFNPDLLRAVRAEVPTPLGNESLFRKDEAHLQEKKFAFRDIPRFGPNILNLIHHLQSKPFLDYVSHVTGIEGLIPDPYFWGAGFHQIIRGGKLAVHADFNVHPQLKLHRRLNILVYLNEGWKEEWGGHIELWDKKMEKCEQKIAPHFNTTVIFNTTSTSYHGHPDPVLCPEGRVRQSLALYYYTADAPDEVHSTLWQKRPQDTDEVQHAADEHKKLHG